MSYYGNPEDNNTIKPIFEGDNYAAKLAAYDTIEEDGTEFQEEVIKKLVYYVSYWYVGQAQTEEEFTEVLKALEETGAADEAQLAIDEAVDKQKEEKAKTPSKKRAAKKAKQKSKTESPEVEAEVVKESNNA